MNDRGMKKWAPYKSLNEQETFLNQMREKRSRIEKPIISQDLAEQINYLLLNHNNKELLFTYGGNGDLYWILKNKDSEYREQRHDFFVIT